MSRLNRKRVVLFCVAMTVCAITSSFDGSADDGPPAIAIRAREVLNRRCFACHGANGVARKNVFVLDRDRLLASRTVVPGDPSSLLLALVETGAMPMGGPSLDSSEKDALRDWIVSGAPNWDHAADSKRTFLTEPALLALIRDDLLRSRERNRSFLRYFSLAHLHNAGVAEAELDVYRSALSKLVNSLSWHREVTPLASIDARRTVFRVDLRDYNWTAATWNLLFAAYPYGIRGSDSRAIDQLSGAPLPYIRADWFVATASVPPLYHDILGLPKTARELEQQLGIDVARDLEEEKNVARAGLRSSGVSSNNRVLERHTSPHGAYWKSFDFRSNLDDQNIFKDPLRLNPAGGEIIFNLPNGLQAYFLVDAFGRRIDEAPIAIVSDRNNADDPVIRNGRSCMSCHYAGVQPFKDDVRPVVRGLSFASFDREKALAVYPTQETLDGLTSKGPPSFYTGRRAGRRNLSQRAKRTDQRPFSSFSLGDVCSSSCGGGRARDTRVSSTHCQEPSTAGARLWATPGNQRRHQAGRLGQELRRPCPGAGTWRSLCECDRSFATTGRGTRRREPGGRWHPNNSTRIRNWCRSAYDNAIGTHDFCSLDDRLSRG